MLLDGDPVAVGEDQGVEGLGPTVDPAGDTAAALTFLLDDEVEDLHRGLFGGEVSAPADGLPESGVEALDDVGGVEDLADLVVVVQKGYELWP